MQAAARTGQDDQRENPDSRKTATTTYRVLHNSAAVHSPTRGHSVQRILPRLRHAPLATSRYANPEPEPSALPM